MRERTRRDSNPVRSRRPWAWVLLAIALVVGAWLLAPRLATSPTPPTPLDTHLSPIAPQALRNPSGYATLGGATAGDAASGESGAPRASGASGTLEGVAGEGARGAEEGASSHRDFLNALTREFPFGRERQAVLREMLDGAPPDAVEALLRLAFGVEEFNDISHVLIERLATLEPEAALVFAREQRFGLDPPWWHSVLGGLSDPRLALGDLLALPESDARARYVGHLALLLGSGDPDAAMRFVLSSAPPEARATAVANVIFAASRRDPADGFELALLYGSEAGDPALVKRVAVDWAMNDYAAALGRLQGMPEGDARQSALSGIASVAIERDLAGAWELLAQVRDVRAREALYLQAAKRYFLIDPAKAAAWLDETGALSGEGKIEARHFAARLRSR